MLNENLKPERSTDWLNSTFTSPSATAHSSAKPHPANSTFDIRHSTFSIRPHLAATCAPRAFPALFPGHPLNPATCSTPASALLRSRSFCLPLPYLQRRLPLASAIRCLR